MYALFMTCGLALFVLRVGFARKVGAFWVRGTRILADHCFLGAFSSTLAAGLQYITLMHKAQLLFFAI